MEARGGYQIAPSSTGKPLAWHLRTKTRRWISLVTICLATTFAQGPVMSWQVLEPLMLDDGIFQCAPDIDRRHAEGVLNRINSIGLGVSAVAGLFAGLYFDVIGPRMLGLMCSLSSAVCFVAMALAAQNPCSFSGGMWFFVLLLAVSCGRDSPPTRTGCMCFA